MEPTRSGIYSIAQQQALALRQAELLAYAEQKAVDRAEHLQRQIDATDQAAVGNRRQLRHVYPNPEQDTGPLQRRNTPSLPRAHGEERFNLERHEIGQASTPFMAQQVAQGQLPTLTDQTIFQSSPQREHQQAAQAYQDTRSLTATVLGLQGFRERIA